MPEVLVACAFIGSAVLAVIDPSYREVFGRLAESAIVGFWAWQQAPKRPDDS